MEAVAEEPTKASQVVPLRVITDFTFRTWTVTPPGAALVVVLAGASLAEQDSRTEITAETGVREGVKGTI